MSNRPDVAVFHGAVADDGVADVAVADVAVADVAIVAGGTMDPDEDEDDWPMLAYVFPENVTAALASHGAPSGPTATPPDTMDAVDIIDVAPGHGKASGGGPDGGGGGGADGFISNSPFLYWLRYFWWTLPWTWPRERPKMGSFQPSLVHHLRVIKQ
jgi:hypothetical protein